MSARTTVPRGWRYEETIPYATPDSLDDLHGPTSGTVTVQGHINTSPHPVYDLSDEAMVWHLYSAVVRDGNAADQAALLDRATLVSVWRTLNLPTRCREIWESKFPQLPATTSLQSV